MTREHKLALIVGFSLILLVGVLISDHLSSARQAQVGELGPGVTVADVGPLVSVDPLRGIESGGPAGWSDPALYEAAAPVPMLPSPIGTLSGEERRMASGPVTTPEPREPVMIGQGAEMTRRNGSNNGLVRAIIEAGGELIEREGIAEIVLPMAAQTRSESARQRDEPQSAPTGAVESAQAEIDYQWHTVERNESLYQISARVYGDGNLWRKVAEHNRDRVDEEGRIRAGIRLRLPPHELVTGKPAPPRPEVQQAAAPRSSSPRATEPKVQRTSAPAQQARDFATYTVRRGDTLGEISQRTLGTARRWQEIAELNSIDNANQVRVGQVLKIPVSPSQS